jgi:hypothetical protein
MAESEERPDLPAPRKTLKLKSPANRAPPERAALPPKAAARNQQGATWADEHKSRMQADMDALNSGAAGDRPDRRR